MLAVVRRARREAVRLQLAPERRASHPEQLRGAGERAAGLRERGDALGERAGFATVLRLRLLPIVPFNVLSFAAGLAGIPFRAYLAATAIGIVPGTVVYTYFADSLLAGVEGASRRAFVRVLVAAALLLAISFAPALVRRLRGRPAA